MTNPIGSSPHVHAAAQSGTSPQVLAQEIEQKVGELAEQISQIKNDPSRIGDQQSLQNMANTTNDLFDKLAQARKS